MSNEQNINLKNVSFVQKLTPNVEPVKRKRGRPRKNQVVNKSTKKRGRKPKNIIQKKPKIFKKRTEEEDIFLCLPINTADVDRYSKINNTISHNTSTDNNKDGSDLRDIFPLSHKVSKKKRDTSYQNSVGLESHTFNTNIFTNTSASISDSSSEDYDEDTIELKKQLKQSNNLVQKLQYKLNEYKNIIDESDMIGINNRTATKMNIQLINIINNKPTIIENTDIACWWCTYNFDTIPYIIPEKHYQNKYYVYGCFCSLPCAAAHILDNNDYNTGNRFSLLKKLYNLGIAHHILPAPSNKVFKKFGGNLSIEEYRKNVITQKKNYRYVMPPMALIVPSIESSYIDASKYNRLRMYNSKDNLVLKRSKPLPNSRNTLLETMKLKKR